MGPFVYIAVCGAGCMRSYMCARCVSDSVCVCASYPGSPDHLDDVGALWDSCPRALVLMRAAQKKHTLIKLASTGMFPALAGCALV